MLPYNVRSCGSSVFSTGGSISGILRKTGTATAPALASMATNCASYAATACANAIDARQPAVDLLVFGYACKIFRDDEKAREMDHGKQLIPWMGDSNLKIDRYDVRGALCDLTPYEAPPGGYGNRLEYLSAEEQRAEQLCEEERYLYLYNNEEEHKLQQEEDLKRLQQETSGGNYSQVGFRYDGQTAAGALGAAQQPPAAEEIELPFELPATLLLPPEPTMQLPDTMKQHAIIEKTARFIAMQGAQMEILIKAKQANNPQFDFLSQGSVLQPYYRHLLAAIKQAKFPAACEPPDTATECSSDAPQPPSPKRPQVITVPTIKYKPSASCAYTQLISKIKGVPLQAVLDDEGSASNSQHSNGTASPTPSCKSNQGEFTPVLLQYNGSTFAHAAVPEAAVEENANDALPKVELLKNTSALALAQNYCSDSEEESEAQEQEQEEAQVQPKPPTPSPPPVLNFPLPEESLRHIIDKTATYVIKNGRQFEETLRTKSVERFNFLLPDNEFYAYYMYKITGDVDAASKEEKTRKAAAVAAALMSKKGLKSASATDKAPVCFSIRARDEHAQLQPALPQETSDDDEEAKAKAATTTTTANDTVRASMPDSVQRAIKQVETQLLARSGSQKSSTSTPSASPSSHKDQRQADERVKDKLAQKARDKLNGLVTREKQLQLERKRKALAFLNQIKTESSADTAGTATPVQSTAAAAAGTDEDSNDSVRSIPITYFGPDDDDEIGNDKPTNGEEDDSTDLEKYNLLNDDSTNMFTSKPPPPPPPAAAALPTLLTTPTPAPASAPVLLSDDDDVQLVGHATASRPSQRSRQRSSSRSLSLNAYGSTSSASSQHSHSSRSRSRSRTHSRSRSKAKQKRQQRKSSVAATPHAAPARKQRQRPRSRSRSRSRHRQRYSRTRTRSRSRSGSSEHERRHHHYHHRRAATHRAESREERRHAHSHSHSHTRHASKRSHHKHHKRRRRNNSSSDC